MQRLLLDSGSESLQVCIYYREESMVELGVGYVDKNIYLIDSNGGILHCGIWNVNKSKSV